MRLSTLASTAMLSSMFLISGANGQQLSQPLSVRPVGFGESNIPVESPNYDYSPIISGPSVTTLNAGVFSSDVVESPAPVGSGAVAESAPQAAMPYYNPPAASAACGCAPAPAASACGTGCCNTAPAPTCQPSCNSCGGGGCNLGGCLGLGAGSGVGVGTVVPGFAVGMQMLKSAQSGACTCDPWTLSSALLGDSSCIEMGGWFSAGYHSESNDLFNNRPDDLNLHQGWLYLEKAATCESPLGFRADFMYGIDGTDTQAFGNDPGNWDFENGFDHGRYSWAIPQLYAELALGENVTVKAGHFYTLIGYEVVTAPDNFFYSHAITMYNSEPFTHTGVLATMSASDDLTIYGGWTSGWDTGFDQVNDGSSWLGGFSYSLNENASFTYISTAGNFGARGDEAYSHSLVLDTQLTDNLNYVVQSDLLRVQGTGEDNVGINQYLLYSMSDCIGLGARFEWWKGDVLTGYAPHGGVLPAAGSLSYYAATFGANIRPSANLTIRPEYRIDWSPAADYDQGYFGVDAIFTF